MEKKTKPLMSFTPHHPICRWGSAAGFVPVGRAASCPVAPTCGGNLWTAQDTEWGTWVWGGWVGEFPTPGCPAVMQLHKMLLL